MKWERKERKASGLLHIFKKALLQIEKRRKQFSPSVQSSFIIQIKRFNSLQEITGHKLQHFQKVVDSVSTFRFPGKKTNKQKLELLRSGPDI